MSSGKCFLMDTNSFVEPSRLYYQFTMFPQYWEFVKERIEDGSIVILDKVKAEIMAPTKKDDLAIWLESIEIKTLVEHKKQEVVDKYAQVLQSIQDDSCYKESAITEWSKNNVADPWLIAAASAYGYSIVTFETYNKTVNSTFPSKEASIPNIAEKFNVPVLNLYSMMKELGFQKWVIAH